MHGLINQAIERFARATYGNGFWERVCRRRNLPVLTFEAMQSYDPEVTEALLDGMAQVLGKPRGEVLEDIGTFLVSSPSTGALRRLLRFGGTGFVDFLLSLDDLPARVEAGQQALDDARAELGTQLEALSATLDDAVSASRADASAANADLQAALDQLRADIEARGGYAVVADTAPVLQGSPNAGPPPEGPVPAYPGGPLPGDTDY